MVTPPRAIRTMRARTRIIDAHSQVGRFGSRANVSCSAEELLAKMESSGAERAILFAPDNALVREEIR